MYLKDSSFVQALILAPFIITLPNFFSHRNVNTFCGLRLPLLVQLLSASSTNTVWIVGWEKTKSLHVCLTAGIALELT